MSYGNGHNPMRWDCERQGCFNVKKRPKIEQFADCLPGRIAFGDVDAVVEIAGNLLAMEWKDHEQISTGQRILFERWTRFAPATVLIVKGDAEFMTVSRLSIAWNGVIHQSKRADIEDLRQTIRHWARWAKRHPAANRQAKKSPPSQKRRPSPPAQIVESTHVGQ